MIKGGYILQPRSIDGSETANMPPVTRELWLYLLRKVNHSDGPQFKRGSNFFALSDIQEDLCWYAGYRKMVYSKPQLTKSLRRLNERNMTATTKATRGVVVTIRNYDYYQDPANYGGNGGGLTKEPRKKSSGRTINNKVEEVKNEKKEPLPDFLKIIWPIWRQHRIEIKKKLTPTTEQGQINKLSKLDHQHAIQTVQNSIDNGWVGLFPDKVIGTGTDHSEIKRKLGIK